MYHLVIFNKFVQSDTRVSPVFQEALASAGSSRHIYYTTRTAAGTSKTRRVKQSDLLEVILTRLMYGGSFCIVHGDQLQADRQLQNWELPEVCSFDALHSTFQSIADQFEWALIGWPPNSGGTASLLALTGLPHVYERLNRPLPPFDWWAARDLDPILRSIIVTSRLNDYCNVILLRTLGRFSPLDLQQTIEQFWNSVVNPDLSMKALGPQDFEGIRWEAYEADELLEKRVSQRFTSSSLQGIARLLDIKDVDVNSCWLQGHAIYRVEDQQALWRLARLATDANQWVLYAFPHESRNEDIVAVVNTIFDQPIPCKWESILERHRWGLIAQEIEYGYLLEFASRERDLLVRLAQQCQVIMCACY